MDMGRKRVDPSTPRRGIPADDDAAGPRQHHAVDTLYGATSALTDTVFGHVVVVGDQPNRLDMIWTWDGHAWVTNLGV